MTHSCPPRRSSDLDQVDAVLRGELRTSDLQVRVEPWLNRAVAFAHGLKLVTVSKGQSVALPQRGEEVGAAIDANATILGDERAFLTVVAKRLTEHLIPQTLRMEALV